MSLAFMTGVLMSSSVSGILMPANVPQAMADTSQDAPIEVIAPKTVDTFKQKFLSLASHYGVDQRLAWDIVTCESRFDQSATNTNSDMSKDFGYWQINNEYHEADAKKAGYDIYKPEDNLEYGFLLLKSDGTRHWKASEPCWKDLQDHKGYDNFDTL